MRNTILKINLLIVMLTLFLIELPISHCKVKVNVKSLNEIKSMLRKKESEDAPSGTTYITIMEGSDAVYHSCQLICNKKNQPTLYSEITDFPGYGSIFRCQCGEDWSSWYNWADMTELCNDILLGDSLFNDYLNLRGYDVDECQCDSLKNLLGKLITNGQS